ncbi:MAG: hypothetical protein P4L33_22465 [Capsulimonadaceae bacterium]|nr:hypothetical protein [Capsulimonadaceae bacterium]
MQVYRCANCQKQLIEGAVFCAHCDSFFDEPVPEGSPAPGASVLLVPSMVPLAQSRRAGRALLKIAFGAAIVCLSVLGVAKPAGHVSLAATSGQASIRQALDADLAADSADSYGSRRYATDVMLSMSTQCFIHHSTYSRRPGDQVLMIASSPLTVRQARNRVLFAAYLLRDLRVAYFPRAHDQTVRILLVDKSGDRIATTIAPGPVYGGAPSVSIRALRA